jgi:hypothetical protein
MTQFKGTKGKWVIGNSYGLINNDCYWETIEVFKHTIVETKGSHFGIPNIEAKYNNLLISKAPEMLKMLEIINKHIKDNENINYAIRLMDREFNIEKLIKEATEI